MPVIMKVMEAKATARPDKVNVHGFELTPDKVNVEFILSVMAACIAKKALEESGAERVEVKISVYADIDKIVEGDEEIEYLEVEIKGYCKDPRIYEEDLERGALKCPILKLIGGKVSRIMAECRRD